MNLPRLRFSRKDGQQFSDWREVSIREISEEPEYGLNAPATIYDGKSGYLRITDIDEKTRKFLRDDITSPECGPVPQYRLEEGDLLFARTGASTGKSYLYKSEDGELYFAGFLIRFKIKDANPDFVFAQTLTASFQKWIVLMSARSGQPGMNASEIGAFRFYCPEIEEQNRISSFLGAVDDKISGLRRKEAALVRFKAGLMQKLFSQKLRFTRDDGSAFPDWKEKQLGALVDLISGQHLGPNDYASDAQGLPYFSGPSDFTNSHEEVTKWTTTPAVKVALPGDTLITVKGSGVGELLSLRFASVAMGRQLMAIRGTAIDGRLVYHRLSSERHEFQARAAGNMIPGLSRSDILSLKFTLPTHPEEQRKIADALSMLDAKNNSVRSQISKMETFKKGLLQQMFV